MAIALWGFGEIEKLPTAAAILLPIPYFISKWFIFFYLHYNGQYRTAYALVMNKFKSFMTKQNIYFLLMSQSNEVSGISFPSSASRALAASVLQTVFTAKQEYRRLCSITTTDCDGRALLLDLEVTLITFPTSHCPELRCTVPNWL